MLKLSRLSWLIVIAMAMLLAGCQPYQLKGSDFSPTNGPMPDFELTAHTGESFELSETDGKIKLIFFGYTFCPDVCPVNLGYLNQIINELDPQYRDDVQVLFISVDPDRDTPEVLAEHMSYFNPSFIGLTGEMSTLEDIMINYGAYSEKREVEGTSADYLVDHTARLYLVGPERNLMLHYPFSPDGAVVDDIVSDIEHLLSQPEA